MMKKILMLVIVLLLVACENPVEPKQSENEFIIELYSYTTGAVTKPKPDCYFKIISVGSSKVDLKGKTDESGKYVLKFYDSSLNGTRYELIFQYSRYDIFEFGKTHVYKGYF